MKAALLAALLAVPMASQAGSALAVDMAGSALAVDMGCYNCHGAYRRGEAPAFEQLAAKFAGLKGDAASEQKQMDKWRQGEWLEHIDAHERISPETARALFHWLVEGAK